jgi:hypothetical protein
MSFKRLSKLISYIDSSYIMIIVVYKDRYFELFN